MYRHYWNQFPVFEKFEKEPPIGISVVVAFRNEEESLPHLLYSLKKQVFPTDLREIILVNDHSHDRSLQIAEDFARMHSGIYCLSNEEGETGKKAALQKGMLQAAFSLIAITDADCTMEDSWLSSISGICNQQNADMVVGLVDMEKKPGFFNRFQEIEFLSLVASGAAALSGGRPIYCNAANLAFKKDLFFSFNDPFSVSVPSGDDTLFMLRVKENPARKIVLMKSVAGIVTTGGAGKMRQFFNQRSRWASKSRYYTDRDILYTAGLVLGVSVVLLFGILAMAFGLNLWLFPALLTGKSLIDFLFMQDFLRFYAKRIHPVLFILFETVYPVYIVVSAGMGIFNRYRWKGRDNSA